MPLQLQHFSWWVALLAFAGAGAIVVFLGLWSLAGLGQARKWTAIAVRLMVILLLILILGGARWERKHDDLEVMVLNDSSGSVDNVGTYPGKGTDVASVQQALDRYYRALGVDENKKKNDRIGLISFRHYARVDAMPNQELRLDNRGTWSGKPNSGTDIAAAIQLGLVTLSADAMHRLVLVTDGNGTTGDLDAAVDAAKAQNVPIDVMLLKYDVQNDVLVDRFSAPEWKRENEPFDLRVALRSTNPIPVSGTLRVKHLMSNGEADLDMDPTTPQIDVGRRVTLKPGLNGESVRVPPQTAAGVHRFRAIFTPDDPAATGSVTASAGGTASKATNDSVGSNNAAEAFTFVRGKGEVLFVDGNARPGQAGSKSDFLIRALSEKGPGKPGEGIQFRKITIDQFPNSIVDLQSYDAVVLYNVPRGNTTESGFANGLDDTQDAMLKSYVHDMGGGLLMIGGTDTFGAGGWTGSETEKILPVDMEIPAQRNVGKGALVLVMHSCEMPNGNYWGEQCAIKAIETLSTRDEIGVISYDWGGQAKNGVGGAQWDVPLREVQSKANVIDAVKRMKLGDMPSFDDALELAVNGAQGGKGLKDSKARHKHIIIISDGDPAAPQQKLLDQARQAKITVSTVTVFPHVPNSPPPPVMVDLPRILGGKSYGPIESNANQLPQIFIKEAQIVKRSLIQEPEGGVPLSFKDPSDDLIKSIGQFPNLGGMVLTSRKNDPKVQMPLATGPMKDPILAYWQSGLGKSAVWTSDAHDIWASGWVGTPGFATLFAQTIRKIQRPPMSGDFDIKTNIVGDKGEIIVEAMDKDAGYQNFLNLTANIVGGENIDKPQQVRLVQIAPGTYRAEFNASEAGAYVAAINYRGRGNEGGMLLTGTVKNGTPEDRALRSDEATLRRIAERTGGRVLTPFDPTTATVFTRDGVFPGKSLKPIWDWLLPWLLALIILDVAVRRIAWDMDSLKKMAAATGDRVRSFTTTRQVEAKPTLDALRKVREDVAETRFKPGEQPATPARTPGAPPPVPTTAGGKPDPKAKFVASKAVEGDITSVVGGATNKPIPSAPKKVEPKGGTAPPGGHLGGLMAAKKRAQQQIKDKEQGEHK
ncbi:vWA domain-containing protein [Humisphaera borealis]|uniref:VWA domain-containing protein n=1 Tax=Humisphaera borealis TaxID=2807512 RepID=A0A7M2X360_9BACT|nr:vWA domain-containing protein [Humisphaera borealis]QOV91461.1 VWA domain-containing protein [Humisphaera borealis]